MFGDAGSLKKGALALFFVLGLLFLNCGGSQASAEDFTIGIITNVQIHVQTMEGFKAGMVELGYVEGKNTRYVYNGVVEGDANRIDAEIETILARHVDLLLTMANEVSLRAKKYLEGSGIPILIAGSSRPMEEGLLESLGHPGGDITGVRVADNYAKTLEWLSRIVPDARRVLVPYNPRDAVSVVALEGLDKSAAKMGQELVCQPVQSVDEAVSIIENLPADVDAIYRIPSPTLDSRNGDLSRLAISKGIPLVACLPLDEAVLMTFSADLFEAGRQTARLAHMIRRGVNPADLPVETCDADLTINLNTAERIGIYIPDEILLQAKTIVR